MAMRCPDCGSELKVESYAGAQIEGCASCGGVWLDSGELKRLVQDPVTLQAVETENVPRVERAEPLNPDRQCPKCGAGLESFHYAYNTPIVLDTCVRCSGIWAQDGELKKIEQVLASEKAPITAREKAALAVADYEDSHEDFMDRQHRIKTFFTFMRRRPPFGNSLGW